MHPSIPRIGAGPLAPTPLGCGSRPRKSRAKRAPRPLKGCMCPPTTFHTYEGAKSVLFHLMKCPCCGALVMLHELERHTAPSLSIDPETGLPPGVGPDGTSVSPSPEATARARRRPLCGSCVAMITACGEVIFSVRLKGEMTALGISSDMRLLDDEGRMLAVRCPSAGCGEVVDLIDGRFARHNARGRECRLSDVQVVVADG